MFRTYLNYSSSENSEAPVLQNTSNIYICAGYVPLTVPQWPNSSVLKTGRREVLGSILGRDCRPSRSQFSVIFSEIYINTAQDPLGRPPAEGIPPVGPDPTCGQLALILQPKSNQCSVYFVALLFIYFDLMKCHIMFFESKQLLQVSCIW